MRRIATAVAILLMMGAVMAPPAGAQTTPAQPPAIVARGEATVKRAPDQAWVSIAAETRASSPAEAQRLAAESMTAVHSALTRASLPAEAVKTVGYSLQPDLEWNNGRSRVRGYIVRNQIEVRVDDLQRLGAVLDAAGASGATSMSGLRFDLKERASVEREALRLAVQDAMARARAMASGAGATLGPILHIDEQRDLMRPQPYMAMRAEAAPAAQTPISGGEIDITAQVTLTVGIR